MSSTRISRRVNAPRASVYQMSLAELAALVETG